MRTMKLAMLSLVILSALVAAGCGGGPKDAEAKLSAACERQIKEIAEAKKEAAGVTAKSTEELESKEQLHECAGQAPIKAAGAPTGDAPATDGATDGDATPPADGGNTPDATAPAGDQLPAGFDVDAARTLFVNSCGGCHMLSDAKTSGSVGPNLDTNTDDAARVEEQIKNGGGAMPAGLLSGDDATNVAAYVASVSPAPGA